MKILGISGSLRAESFNTRLLKAACELIREEGVVFEIHEIARIPLYNSDLDGGTKPEPVVDLIDAITGADGVLFATPEYNYSISGVLKNAIDWASRPAFNSCLTRKPCAVLSASMSTLGGARAQVHLRDILLGTLSPIYLAPDFLLASAHNAFDANGALVDQKTMDFLKQYLHGYISWLKSRKNA